MDKGRFLIETHLRTGRPIAELARAHGVSRGWLYKLLARHRAEGDAGLEPRSRRPLRSPTRIAGDWEDEIVLLRKELNDLGVDAGAMTIQSHLSRRHDTVPSVATIWRVLKARGFVVPQPHKRPKSSLIRFAAELPNECWQADVTHVTVADGTVFEVLNVIINTTGYRVRHDRIDKSGGVTIRHKGRLHHIGVGNAYKGWRVVLLVAGLEIRILTLDGIQLRRLKLDPSKDYQPMA